MEKVDPPTDEVSNDRKGFTMAPSTGCQHHPECPAASDIDHDAARIREAHPEQGWTLLCNGVIVFEDLGEIHPDGHCCESRLIPLQQLQVATRA